MALVEGTQMKTSRIAQALSAIFAISACGAVFAATTTTDGINPPSASDTGAINGTYQTGGFASGSSNIGDFTASRYNGPDVLVGATFSATLANEPVSFTRSGSGTTAPAASAYATGQLSVAGITATANSSTINSGTIGFSGVSGTIPAYTVTGTATTQTQLDNLYGSGTVAGTVNEALYINKTAGSNGYTVNVNNTSNRTATVDYTYQTMSHANGSFSGASDVNSLTLDFGTIIAGTTPAALTFSLYNAIGSWALQYVSGNYTGSGLFLLSGVGSGVTNLAGGSFVNGMVGMMPTLTPGSYSGTWTFFLADSASGIAAGRNFSNTDTLTLNVHAQVAAVPEPGEWAMMLAGLGLLGLMASRKRRRGV